VLVVSAVFASGVVTPSKFALNTMNIVQPNAPPPNSVAVNPGKIVKDWLLAPTYRTGNKFTVVVNVTSVTDLYTWQINMTWSNKTVVSVSKGIGGEFLARSASPTSSEQLGLVINSTDNTKAYSALAETLLGATVGITGTGNLTSIEFSITGYGWTLLTISGTGNLQTTLLNSAGTPITLSAMYGGYFSNRLFGDGNSDRKVSYPDFTLLAGAYGSLLGQPAYKIQTDFNYDQKVNYDDFVMLAGNYGKAV
jgi:hypothetical protein